MPAQDFIHEAVKKALIKDGWTITDDPLIIDYQDARVFVDLGAKRVIAAERDGEKIAVEIKTFAGRSAIHDMEIALGQYVLYLSLLEAVEPDRKLYIAVSSAVYESIIERGSIQFVIRRNRVPFIVVNLAQEEIVQWIS